ncbi:MAG: tRNA epoxyqueuosine(34) reductase QueG [bacterium]|nr:tRNA epoxyqueuosine(34) reductase QueG [bacterium]
MVDAQEIKRLAYQVGFDLCGICSPDLIPEARERYYLWLEKKYHGELGYLAKDPQRRSDPRLLLEGGRSVIMLGLNYYQPNSEIVPEGCGRVSRYARGRDYHKVIAKKTKEMIRGIESELGSDESAQFRWFVDYGPMLERAYAEKAGFGYVGRNGMLISRQFGSWLFLAEIITTLELLPDDPKAIKHGTCGTCKKCIDACPTGAIVEDRVVDSTKCISYLTIERPVEFDEALIPKIGDRIFGCDVCQEVCPHNFQRQKLTKHDEFLSGGVGEFIDTRKVLAMQTREDFLAMTSGTPLTRTKLEGLQRSAGWVRGEGR